MIFQRKKKEDDGLDIIENVKEPFSFANFVEDHIITKWKKFKNVLEERGVLFFLVSPFQYRNRLIAKITLVVIGVLIGIVPRTFTLIDETKERNAGSEIASIEGNVYQVGKITTRPLASSQYEKQHVLAFLIEGDTDDGVPSTTDKYEVTLSQKRGVSDMASVTSQYEILPIDTKSRLLVVYVNNQKQNDETGNYNLLVKIKDETLKESSSNLMEIVLSNNQQTTTLFNSDGIHLSSLSNQILNTTQTPIATAESKLKDALNVYALNEERLAAAPMNATIDMSSEQLVTYVQEYTQLPNLSDTSNSEDIEAMEYDKNFATNHPMELKAGLSANGNHYTVNDTRNDQSNEAMYKEVDNLATTTNNVISAISGLNSARSTKYMQLMTLQNTLNQTFVISNITGTVVVLS